MASSIAVISIEYAFNKYFKIMLDALLTKWFCCHLSHDANYTRDNEYEIIK